MQYVEALDCKKREKSTEKQTVFSKRQLLANCENKPFKLRIDGFLLSEDYEKVADFIKKHEGTTTPPKIEEYEKDPWIMRIILGIGSLLRVRKCRKSFWKKEAACVC